MSSETCLELHTLVDQRSDENVAEVLADARWLMSEEQATSPESRLATFRALFDERSRD